PLFGRVVAAVACEPHLALLARRHWPYALCQQRREFLRAMHWWPQRGTAVVVRGGAADTSHVGELARALSPQAAAVALEAEPGDRPFARALVEHLGPRALSLRAAHSSLDDRIAAIAGAAYVIDSTQSTAVAALARAYHRPFVTLDAAARG